MKYIIEIRSLEPGYIHTFELRNFEGSGKGITYVEFRNDIKTKNMPNYANNIDNQVVVRGLIQEENRLETQELMAWSLATDKVKMYREVKITVIKDVEVVREYILNRAFVSDYKEVFDALDNNGEPYYELLISQRSRY